MDAKVVPHRQQGDANASPKDPSQNFIEHYPLPLDGFFAPRSVALIGAKDDLGTVGRTMLVNLLAGGFGGKVYPVNPKRKEVLGLPCYPTVAAIGAPVDLAIIVTPAHTVPAVIADCGAAAIPCAIVISAGFKELGAAGAALEQQVLDAARRGAMRIIGPNCLGVMNPLYGLNATFAKGMALPGNIAFISQSGAMCTAVLDWSLEQKVGFSAFVSIGSMADVNWGDIISYLGAQPTTQSILLYMETIGDPRSFLSAAREIALEKPIIVIKAGRSAAAAHAAASHTGSMAGSDEVFEAAMERVGVLRVESISELFRMASVLSKQPLPRGPRLTIVTNAGGPSVLATDAAALHGAELPKPSARAMEQLNALLPEAWSHSNPVDILGDARPERFRDTIDIMVDDESSDGLLVVLSPQDVTDPVGTAEALRLHGTRRDKPLLASWMGGSSVHKGVEILNQAGIPAFAYPDEAAWTFATMWRYSHNLAGLYQFPALRDDSVDEPARRRAAAIIAKAFEEGRELLTEFESKEVLSLYGIPCVVTKVARSQEEAVRYAEEIGYPAVVKLFSSTITHKTDVGGVKLNLTTAEEVRAAYRAIEASVGALAGPEHFEGVTVQKMVQKQGYELIVGSSSDPQFGPVLLFGCGGQLVEVFQDRALALPPLNDNLARRLMAHTKIYKALLGVRGQKAVSLDEMARILVRFSQMVVENPLIKECDINPLLAGSEAIIALDARLVLHSADECRKGIPKVAIRPYPHEYVSSGVLRDGSVVRLRPIRPEDRNAVAQFHRELSENSVRQRYFAFLSLDERIAKERLVRICFNDYDREVALIAELEPSDGGAAPIVGVLRLGKLPTPGGAEIKLIIADAFHNKGLGTMLMAKALEVAPREGIDAVHAHVLAENGGMIHLCQKAGFRPYGDDDDPVKHMLWRAPR